MTLCRLVRFDKTLHNNKFYKKSPVKLDLWSPVEPYFTHAANKTAQGERIGGHHGNGSLKIQPLRFALYGADDSRRALPA